MLYNLNQKTPHRSHAALLLALSLLIACGEERAEESAPPEESCAEQCGENIPCLEECFGRDRSPPREPGACPYEDSADCRPCLSEPEVCTVEERCEEGWCAPISCRPERPCPEERGLRCEDGRCRIAPDADLDRDGVPDAVDNCAELINPSQSDCDLDGVGDPCDPDPQCGATLMGLVEQGVPGLPELLRVPGAYLEVTGLSVVGRSDETGNFRLDGLPVGEHEIVVYAPNEEQPPPEELPWSGFSGAPIGVDRVSVLERDFNQSLFRDLVLRPTGDIGGQIFLDGIPFYEERHGGTFVGVVGYPTIRTETGPGGDFLLRGLPEGQQQLQILRQGYAPLWLSVEVVALQRRGVLLSSSGACASAGLDCQEADAGCSLRPCGAPEDCNEGESCVSAPPSSGIFLQQAEEVTPWTLELTLSIDEALAQRQEAEGALPLSLSLMLWGRGGAAEPPFVEPELPALDLASAERMGGALRFPLRLTFPPSARADLFFSAGPAESARLFGLFPPPGERQLSRQISLLISAADRDRDGLVGDEDPDEDGDGCLDEEDAFPLDPFSCLDLDGDAVRDEEQPVQDGEAFERVVSATGPDGLTVDWFGERAELISLESAPSRIPLVYGRGEIARTLIHPRILALSLGEGGGRARFSFSVASAPRESLLLFAAREPCGARLSIAEPPDEHCTPIRSERPLRCAVEQSFPQFQRCAGELVFPAGESRWRVWAISSAPQGEQPALPALPEDVGQRFRCEVCAQIGQPLPLYGLITRRLTLVHQPPELEVSVCSSAEADPAEIPNQYAPLSCYEEVSRGEACVPRHLFSQQGFPLVLTGLELPDYQVNAIGESCFNGLPDLESESPSLTPIELCGARGFRRVSYRLSDGVSADVVSDAQDPENQTPILLNALGTTALSAGCWGGNL